MKRRFIPVLIGLLLLLSAVLVGADGKLVIYNAGTPEMGDDLVRAFKAKYRDIDVEVIRLGSGEVITRVQAEARRPQGDITFVINFSPQENSVDHKVKNWSVTNACSGRRLYR